MAPDDWHVHVRDEDVLKSVLPWTAQVFERAVIMPNLKTPITTVALADAYRQRILKLLPRTSTFQPLMTFYLTDQSDPKELVRGLTERVFTAAKLYPAFATTHAEHGVSKIENIYPCLEVLEAQGQPLLVHAEDPAPAIDVFDREVAFLENTLTPLLHRFPRLKVVVEHITTREAVQFVLSHGGRVGATITAHHLLINRNAMFNGGFRPHFYCLPVAKREEHRLALMEAATSGSPSFFLGTDSAPHSAQAKESACGCAGIFSAPGALLHYAEVFSELTSVENFEAFASRNGAQFYGLPLNQRRLRLQRHTWRVPEHVELTQGQVVKVFRGLEQLGWSLA